MSLPVVAQSQAIYPIRFQDVTVNPPVPLVGITVTVYPHGSAHIPGNVINRQPNGTSGSTDANGLLVPPITLTVGGTYDFVTSSPILPLLTVTAPQTTAWTIGAPASGPPGPIGPSGAPGALSVIASPPVLATLSGSTLIIAVSPNPVFQGNLTAANLRATAQTLGSAFFDASGNLIVKAPTATALPSSCAGYDGSFQPVYTTCAAAGATVVSPGPNVTIAGTGSNPVVKLATPVATALPSSVLGMDSSFNLQMYPPPKTPYPTPIPTCATANCSFAGFTLTVPTQPTPTSCPAASALPCAVWSPNAAPTALSYVGVDASGHLIPTSVPAGGGTLTGLTAGTNVSVGTGATPIVAVASPTATGIAIPAICAGWSSITGGPLLAYTCPPSPYPTPATPTPLPSPNFTAGNSNVTVTNNFPTSVTISAITPAPQNTLAAWTLVVAPTATSMAVGVVTEPFRLNPTLGNPRALATHAGCDTAGSGGSSMAWTWEYNLSDDLTGAWTTAAPIPTASLASNTKLAGGATFAPAAIPTGTDAAHITWYRARVTVAPTTPVSGTCRFFLDGDQTTH